MAGNNGDDLLEPMDACPEAEAALRACAEEARLRPDDWTHIELCVLYGRSARPDAEVALASEPFYLSPYERARVIAWHRGCDLDLSTRLRLVAAYVCTGDIRPDEDGRQLREIARRAGVSSSLRARAAELCARWFGEGEETLRIATRSVPATEKYEGLFVAFGMEAERLLAADGDARKLGQPQKQTSAASSAAISRSRSTEDSIVNAFRVRI